jgi:hypothetical protein
MTKRIGNKDIAHQRSKEEKKDIRKTNKAREAIKQAIARSRYRNAVRKHQVPVVVVQPV